APEVSLVTSFRTPPAQPAPVGPAFWSDFVCKCRLAWDVFFPAPPANLPVSPAGAVRNRLQMILVSDRSGLDLPTLLKIKNQSLAALAQSNGWANLAELELQVMALTAA
ncbi:uncharacterized protein HaLaN_21793, partial [Haematococcus lacustris]